MKITKEWVKNNYACSDGVTWYEENSLTDVEHTKLINMLVDDGRLDWTFWLISKLLDSSHNLRWACNSARLVLPIFEAENPGDNSARKCIECAESSASTYNELCSAIELVEAPTEDSTKYSYMSAFRYAALSAFRYADREVALSAALSAAWYAAESDSGSATRSGAWSANSVDHNDIKRKIIDFGLQLIKEQVDD